MTPERQSEIREEWNRALPRVLEGAEEGQSLVCFNQHGKMVLWEPGRMGSRKRSATDILRAVAWASGVTVDDIRGSSKQPHIVKSRRVAIYLLKKEHPDLTYAAIGRLVNKERTAVTRGIEEVRCNTDVWTAWVLREVA